MADITMCDGHNCPLKDNCYRFIAPVNEYRQSYFAENPSYIKDNKTKCDYYWEVKNDRNKINKA